MCEWIRKLSSLRRLPVRGSTRAARAVAPRLTPTHLTAVTLDDIHDWGVPVVLLACWLRPG